MKGYLNRPEATAAMIDGEGWLQSGDVGRADADGYVYVVDRVKELIKYKGCEVPKAFVVLKGEATPVSIVDWVAQHVAPHKKVREVEVIDQIPKSASGKILRRVLVERERSRA